MKYYEMNHEKKGKIYEDKVYEEERYYRPDPKKSGMEMVQVAVLICIAVAVGLVFKEKLITVNPMISGNRNAASTVADPLRRFSFTISKPAV